MVSGIISASFGTTPKKRRDKTVFQCETSILILDGTGSSVLNAGSAFIVGTELNENDGSFSENLPFVGMITGVNAWSKILSNSDIMNAFSCACQNYFQGNLLQWSGFTDGVHGNVQLRNAFECKMPGKCSRTSL